MENVVAFNNELSSLYEQKPPISKAKMAAITKSAMRAIKFYKHVVQSVEKFILKCKPEYKVPGLYVIDSIVRQSRHQFGPDKDVFAPRFARNIKETFANLFRCAPDDKSRIIRVLNLWQKNNVFAPEVIQPIFDLADPNHPIYQLPPPGATGGTGGDIPTGAANGMNNSSTSMEINMNASSSSEDKHGGMPDLSNNNLQQLLNDPNVLLQLQTLQNFQKMKQQEEQQYKINEMRMQEKEFEKHLQTVLKTQSGVHGVAADPNEFNKEVEFVSVEQKIEVINLDGNDSRSPSPAHDRDRYKSSRRRSSRSRSRSRSRDRGRRRRSRSRSRSRSPRGSYRRRSSRDRDRDRSERSLRDKEKEREHERERRRKGLPDIKKEHLSVCSTTLWVGHLSKLVYQEELSDTFGTYGDIVSIDLIVPRGCAFIVMNRRQDAHKAMQNLKNHKLQGRAITISWAAGKGVKSKEWKDFWDLELGVTYIPWSKLDTDTDLDALEEGGMFDEDSMPGWVKDKINHMKSLKEKAVENIATMPPGAPPATSGGNAGLLFGIDTTQPPPGPPPTSGPPPKMPMVPVQFPMAPPMGGPPRMLGPMGPMSISGIPMPPNMVPPGMPPPHPMMLPTGMISQAFPPIPSQIAGGNGPPPGMVPPLGMPPPGGSGQFHPPPTAMASGVPPPVAANATTGDDQMDIEMDEEDGPASANVPIPVSAPPSMNFNHPPPMFAGPGGAPGADNNAGDIFSRDRGRERGGAGPGSRWSERGGGREEVDLVEAAKRWRENNGQSNFNEGGAMGGAPPSFNDAGMGGPPNFNDGGMGGGPPNFNEGGMGGGPPNFNDGGRGGRGGLPMNIQTLDMNNPPHRPDFMNDFDGRVGPRGGLGGPRGGGNHNGDFYPNMQNRFNQPTSLMQMRIPPPNAFNQRMGGPVGGPMFMRGGHGGPGGGPGQGQGPGRQGFFNPRNPFDRDVSGGRGGRGNRGGRGGGRNMGGHGAPGTWSDDEGDDGKMFKRRGGGPAGPSGPGGNRFRDRDGPEEWHGRGGPGGNRRGGGRDRNDHRDNERNDRNRGAGRRNSRDETREVPKTSNNFNDTEDDWDLELEEYKPENTAKKSAPDAYNSNAVKNKENNVETAAKKPNEDAEIVEKNEPTTAKVVCEPALPKPNQEILPVEKETHDNDTPQLQQAKEDAAPKPAPASEPEAPAPPVYENIEKSEPPPETPVIEKVTNNEGAVATQPTAVVAEKPSE